MKHHFEITYKNKGPLNLKTTIYSGQTSQPPWQETRNYFQELVLVDNKPTLINIGHDDSILDSDVEVTAQCKGNIAKKSIELKIREIFSLNHDLNKLYDFLESDTQLAPAIEFCKGLRIFKAQNPFECVISSISSANCSIVRWTRSMNDIKQKWGEKCSISDEDFYTFPNPHLISQLPESDLEEMQRCEDKLSENFKFTTNLQACGVGYRAKYIIQAAKMVENDISLEELAKMKYEDAFETILKLPGVGPKVADCILLYGFGMGEAFPVDVWIKRIICHLYFNGKDVSVPKIREFGMERFEEYAGYTQLYLFHYARKSGLLEKLTPNKK